MRVCTVSLFAMASLIVAPGLALAATIGSLSDNFDAAAINAANWTVSAADFEAGTGTYTADQTTNPGQLTIAGVNDGASFWGGTTLQSVDSFDSSMSARVMVNRSSISGTGSAYRSSLWIRQTDGDYLHFAQNVGENGWQFNNNNTGGGTNIGSLNGLDGSLGSHNMQLLYQPLGGSNARVSMFLDGVFAASTTYGGWQNTTDFQARLSGMARAAPGDTVSAQFDNFNAQSFSTPTQTTAANNVGFTVSNSDLIEGVVPTVSGTALGGQEGTSSNPAVLSNGTFGPADMSNLGEVVSISNDTQLTYNLDLSSAPMGYEITGIDSYSGWRDGGRDNQDFAVLFETVNDPGVFQALDVVSFNPGGIGNPADTMVSISDALGGPLATNVSAIRFSFPGQENGYVGYREFDVFGSAIAVPEPASIAIWSLLGLAGFGFGWFRWRKTRSAA